MTQQPYTIGTNLTAVPPETARRQSLNVYVFIDGNNWYNRLKELINDSLEKENHAIRPSIYFDLHGFCSTLVEPHHLVGITYYIGTIKQKVGDDHNQKLYASQQRLFRFLRNHNITLKFGHIITHPDGSFHEKGVDLRLALDMYKMAVANAYDIAYLISSDNDLHPVVEECRILKKPVVYVGSSLRPAYGLQTICQKSILLQQKDVLPFMPVLPPKDQQSLLPNS